LGAASILANLHHRRIIPLMERELRIFEMNDEADPTALACSRLLNECFPREYVVTRARRAISLKSVPHDHDDLWSFIMLPDAPAVSDLPSPLNLLQRAGVILMVAILQRVTVNAARSDPPTLQAWAVAHAAQRREQEQAARGRERGFRRRERREQ
jgi:hypothetical protein